MLWLLRQYACRLLLVQTRCTCRLLRVQTEPRVWLQVEVLRGFELTAEWTEQQLRDVASVLTVRKFPADKVVVHQVRHWQATCRPHNTLDQIISHHTAQCEEMQAAYSNILLALRERLSRM